MNNHTSSLESSHFPVMLNEVLKITSPFNGGKYIDCTFGGGGYSKEILKIPKTEIAAIDRDDNIKSIAEELERKFPKRLMTKSKISGGYVNGIMAHDQAKRNGYHEAILLDTTGFVAEGSGQNIFLIKDGKLFTPALTCCLNGITRRTVIQIAKDHNIEVIERNITRDELYTADEIFFCGTAVEVTPIRSVDKTEVGNGARGEITTLIQSKYLDAVRGEAKEYSDWLSKV